MKRMMLKKIFIVYLIATFVMGIFAPMMTPAYAFSSSSSSSSDWLVSSPKGQVTTSGTGSFETWADGKQYWVVRD
ncbi:MAG TPA: hypothetical protein PKL57_06080, partial [Candidatus Wallbacteria bacterium]|nr:hypothetical protein [Candidatus Wallbacteria bacterium]